MLMAAEKLIQMTEEYNSPYAAELRKEIDTLQLEIEYAKMRDHIQTQEIRSLEEWKESEI